VAEPSTRLHVLLARRSGRAVVFRRGPSERVALIGWDTERHAFELGQWFHGRLYERRCDLSPSGELLVYFAGRYRDQVPTWTAVSRPPYLTALVRWPKGDAWGGGGLFADERTLELNHPPSEWTPADGVDVPTDVRVRPFGARPGGGEDVPVWWARLERDGWVRRQDGESAEQRSSAPVHWVLDPPAVWAKAHRGWVLEMLLRGVGERGGSWYVLEHRVLDRAGEVVLDLGRTDWADWSRSGELLFARDGRLYRVRLQRVLVEEELIDLRGLRSTPLEPPPEALGWRSPAPRGSPLPRPV
jgi:hypothetical protein